MKGYKKLIAFGDEHLPTAHAARLRILLDVIEAEKPDIIISGGDMINCDCLSDYNKTHDKLVGLQKELKQAHAWIESINKVAPKAEKILLKDNHFFRRLSDKMTREHWLSDLEGMKPENLLKLDKYGWEAVQEYNGHAGGHNESPISVRFGTTDTPNDTLNLRENSSASSKVLTRLKDKTKIKILNEGMNGSTKWYYVDHNTIKGWVAARFIKEL